jgi:tetratricopeptide (TPR) repeat protein
VIGVAALVATAMAAAPYSRARTQLLLGAWAAQHGDDEAARAAARAALFHDADGAAPRVLLARLLPDDPASTSEATTLLEAAVANPVAGAEVYAELGRVHARAGRLAEARAAFAEAEARGAGPGFYPDWLAALAPAEHGADPAAVGVSARWQAVANPGPGGFGERAARALTPTEGAARVACADALAAARLGEAVTPSTVADRCRAAGLPETGTAALALLIAADAEALDQARVALLGGAP